MSAPPDATSASPGAREATAARADAAGKVILTGEHAAVYGEPAVAVPLSALRLFAEVAPAAELTVASAAEGDLALARAMASLALARLGAPGLGLAVRLRSDIPPGRGLGSSAALAVALVRAVAAALQVPLTPEQVAEHAYPLEVLAHGNPSGVDNTVVAHERPVFFVRGQPPQVLPIGAPLRLVVGDTGVASGTKEVVSDVARHIRAAPDRYGPVIAEIGEISRSARDAVVRGALSALGPLLDRNHALLQELTVSSPRLDALVHAARAAGALGAKLCGAGRGGNAVALVTRQCSAAVERAMRDAGAARVYATTVEASA